MPRTQITGGDSYQGAPSGVPIPESTFQRLQALHRNHEPCDSGYKIHRAHL
jgi:hypothetical protein